VGRFILDKHGNPKPEPDLIAWAEWMAKAVGPGGIGVVKKEMIGESKVSTVFLGLDYNFDEGPPILWETMVFGGELDQMMDRCAGNKEQAEAMHAAMASAVRLAAEARA
jgi:hypothetical protein